MRCPNQGFKQNLELMNRQLLRNIYWNRHKAGNRAFACSITTNTAFAVLAAQPQGFVLMYQGYFFRRF